MMLSEDELMAAYRHSGSEDELLATVTEALTLCGWRWQHVRRSDLAIVQGTPGFPDVIAVRGPMVLALELKREDGRPTGEQVAWLRALGAAGILAAIVRPSDLDDLLLVITGQKPGAMGALLGRSWGAGHPLALAPEPAP